MTSIQAFDLIREDGEIRNNRDGTHPHTRDWSKVSTHRERGYVSMCDLRSVDDEQPAFGLSRYPFLNPNPAVSGPVFLFLAQATWPDLLTYAEAMTEDPVPGHLAPYIESGYPDAVSLDLIEEALVVSVIP